MSSAGVGGQGGTADQGAVGGAGGDALGGRAALLARGTVVTVDTASLDASAFAGGGGIAGDEPISGAPDWPRNRWRGGVRRDAALHLGRDRHA